MRRIAILIVVAGLWAVGASPAAAQQGPPPDVPGPPPDVPQGPPPDIPQGPPPDVPEDPPVPEVPDEESPEPPADDGGGGGGESPELPGDDEGGGGSPVETPSAGGGPSSDGGSSRAGEGPGSASCPCTASATGYPVNGDYAKRPVEDGAPGVASGNGGAGLAPSRSSDNGADGAAGGVLAAGVFGDGSEPPADRALLGEDSGASLLASAVFALAGLGLLVGIAGGVRSWHRERQGFP